MDDYLQVNHRWERLHPLRGLGLRFLAIFQEGVYCACAYRGGLIPQFAFMRWARFWWLGASQQDQLSAVGVLEALVSSESRNFESFHANDDF